MNHLREIKESIQNIADMHDTPSPIFTAFVVECKGDVCTVRCGRNQYTGVKLRAINDGDLNHLIVTPKPKSQVLVADLSNGHMRDLCVVQYSQIEKVELSFGKDQSILIEGDSDGGVKFNGGTNDGLARIGKIESNLEKLKSYVETLQTQTATAMAPMASLDSGVSVGTFNTSWGTTKTMFSFEDMENTKIKH